MSQLRKPKEDGDVQFCWGEKGYTHYESFTFDGTEYFLYDCVYVWNGGPEPDIGKLIRIWETSKNEKKVEALWFFRPNEIVKWLGDIKPLPKEIFLACGEGHGLSNIGPLGSIAGKCEVICSSEDQRNYPPTQEEFKTAEYIFYRTFDVEKCTISDQFPNTIAGIEVDRFLNGNKDRKSSVHLLPAVKRETSTRTTEDGQPGTKEKGYKIPAPIRPISTFVKDGLSNVDEVKNSQRFKSADLSVSQPKKRRLIGSLSTIKDARPDTQERATGREKVTSATGSCRGKSIEKAGKVTEKGAGDSVTWDYSRKFLEVSKRPDTDSSKWLKLKWNEERSQEAHEKGTLVLLENLLPSLTSEEVENIVWHAFELKVKAKMLPCSAFTDPNSGQALVIFKSKEAADDCVSRLTNGCLVLGLLRPIVGRQGFLRKSDPARRFFGHLCIDKMRAPKQHDKIKNAISTSHFSQSNTIEYDLAMQWSALQAKSDMWLAALYEEQKNEVKALKVQRSSV